MESTKEKALARLSEIEKETKQLRKIIEGCDGTLKNIMERVKTLDDAVFVLGETKVRQILEDVYFSDIIKEKDFSIKQVHSLPSYVKLVLICAALNEDWEPNPSDTNEYKYYPYFQFNKDKTKPSGFGFSYGTWAFATSASAVGFRLCFKTKELAVYVGNQFTELYREYITK